jgi:hypothetical protein
MASTEACQVVKSDQDTSRKTMPPCTFNIKLPLDTQFTFGSLAFAVGEHGDLKMLPLGTALEHLALTPSSTSSGTCLDFDPFTGLYIRTVKLVQGILIVTSILRPFGGASSSSSSASSPNRDSSNDSPISRPAPSETPQKMTTSSLWWPQTEISSATTPVDIPLLGDQMHLMPELLAPTWFRI